MAHRTFVQVTLTCIVFACSLTTATEHLVLIGGGIKPARALERFSQWAGGKQAHLLFITWATAFPEYSVKELVDDFSPYHPRGMEAAPTSAEMPTKKGEFLKQLARATGVFFSGGDQNNIMDVLADRELLSALRAKFHEGAAFAGTSAGTAIMSRTMMTGEGNFDVIEPGSVGTREGLGLLSNLVVDQHFLKRSRENRLFSVLLRSSERMGMGIDENTAVSVEDSRYAEVLGPTQVMLVEAEDRGVKFAVELLQSGETFDLALQKRIKP